MEFLGKLATDWKDVFRKILFHLISLHTDARGWTVSN